MNKKLKASIGIAAYNEENNIIPTLKEILAQSSKNYDLIEIIVNSDGSSDQTDKLVRKFKHPKVKLMADGKRKGKATRVNEILQKAKSEACILLDADVNFKSSEVLDNLVEPFLKNKKIVLVSGIVRPNKPKSFVQRILYKGTELWDKTRDKYYGAGAYFCSGGIRAMRKPFYKVFRFPKITAEDIYPYLYCKYHKLGEFAFVGEAVIMYTLPNTVSDYIKQMKRYLGSFPEQGKFFSEEFLQKELVITTADKMKVLVFEFIKSPVFVSLYIILLAVTRIQLKFSAPNSGAVWAEIKSSK